MVKADPKEGLKRRILSRLQEFLQAFRLRKKLSLASYRSSIPKNKSKKPQSAEEFAQEVLRLALEIHRKRLSEIESAKSLCFLPRLDRNRHLSSQPLSGETRDETVRKNSEEPGVHSTAHTRDGEPLHSKSQDS